MNINDYKDVNGNVLVSEQLISDLIAIVESGSNANGHYVKWADGTMICYGEKAMGAIEDVWGSGYRSNPGTIATFPQAFISVPAVFVAGNAIDGSASWGSTDFISTTDVYLSLYRFAPTASVFTSNWTAIGRWK